ncbi:MAG UNVERIFIED_CONTAM: Rpn family recombination-promoting nuclease/putative transposase [Rickettsiaceae bacterium]|jgi:predicted transposase/invertase (TIGR01784 family)
MFSKYLDPKNDVAFKKIFGSEKHKDILIHFINDILGFKGNRAIKEVTFLSTVQDPEIASKKQSIVDVLCKDSNDTQYIIEMQVAETSGFEKRAQYYAAKAYSGQLNRGQGEDGLYKNLKEIIFIAIADFILFPDKSEYKSDHVILDKKTQDHDLKDFYFTFIELPKFRKKSIDELENMEEKWCYFFKYAQSTKPEDFKKLVAGDLVLGKAYEVLEQYNWTEQELLAYERETKRVWDNRAAEDAILEKAEAIRKKGREEGEAKGLEKGKAEGLAEGLAKVAKNMLKQGLQVDVISKVTGLSEAEIKALTKGITSPFSTAQFP